jgi:hypothetical protein
VKTNSCASKVKENAKRKNSMRGSFTLPTTADIKVCVEPKEEPDNDLEREI